MNMLRILLAVTFSLILATGTLMAQNSTVYGIVLSYGAEKQPLSGATVFIPELQTGTSTDRNGLFVISNISAQTITLRVSYVGFETIDTLISLPREEPINIILRPSSSELESVIITEQIDRSDFAIQVPLSTTRISARQIQTSPRVFGEIDLIRVIQNLPGVKAESDYSGGLYVRGGRNDQNLILIDGIPVYNPWHFFGLFGSFNSDVIESVEFNKGVFPARYGNRLSSLMRIETNDGHRQPTPYSANIGLLSASLSTGAPINDKSSLSVGFRRTYMEPFLNLLDDSQRFEGPDDELYKQSTNYYFVDVNARYRYRINDNHLLHVSSFYSTDQMRLASLETYDRKFVVNPDNYEYLLEDRYSKFGWSNIAAGIRLRSTYRNFRLSNQFYATYFSMSNTDRTFVDFNWQQKIQHSAGLTNRSRTVIETNYYGLEKSFDQELWDLGYIMQIDRDLSDVVTLESGFEFVRHRFRRDGRLFEEIDYRRDVQTDDLPIRSTINASIINRGLDEDFIAINSAISLALDISLQKFKLFPGLRYEYFSKGMYSSFLPRVNAQYTFGENLILTAGYGQFAQYFHAVGIGTFQLLLDNWIWTEETIKPSKAETFTLGFRYQNAPLGSFTVEGYHKTFAELLNFDPVETYKALNGTGALIPVYTQVTTTGVGRAYGIEFQYETNINRLELSVGYTISWSNVRFDGINEGNWYPSRTDSRNDITSSLNYTITPHWLVGLGFSYKTGQPITWSYSAYLREEDPLEIGDLQDGDPLIWKNTNNFRLPDYHRLDVFLTYQNRPFFGARADYSLSVINTYNRNNILAINPQTTFRNDESIGAVIFDPKYRQIPQMPLLPMIGMRIYGVSK